MISVLHIDNTHFYKKILKSLSLEIQFNYFAANTPQEASTILKNNHIDLIITALEFKHDSGETFIKSLNNSEYNNIPIIVLTSSNSMEMKNKMFQLGVIDYILKEDFVNDIEMYIQKLSHEDFAIRKLKELDIAVLDDSVLELNIINKILKLNNINNVDYYSKPEELLMSDKKYSIYLIDFILQNISGEKVILDIRRKHPYSLIISISGISNYKVITHILSSGADDYISKPFNEYLFMARLKANVRTFALLEELKQKNIELREMVNNDGLTKLLNHNALYERLEEEIQRARHYNVPLSILMMDIDKFKNINDTYGHQVGDMVLKKVSKLFKEKFRQTDIIGRYGGEEFIGILIETSLKGACVLGERIRTEVEKFKFEEEGLKVTISIGVVEFNGDTALKLVERVDKLLYKAKNNGRNRIEFN